MQCWEHFPPVNVSPVRYPFKESCMGCIMNLLFVIVLSPELFLSTPVFHRPQKPVFLNSKSHSVDMPLQIFIPFHSIVTNLLHRVQRSEVRAEPTYLRYSRYLEFYRRSNYCGLLGSLRSTYTRHFVPRSESFAFRRKAVALRATC